MGFKSATNTNVKKDKYKINTLIFSSRIEYQTIESIDRNLRFLYSPALSNSLWPTINYSPTRDNVNNFNAILDRVEERIDRFNKKVKIIETDDSAFNEEFPGIIDFLYEASELPESSEKYFEKRFIYISKRLWDMGIHPNEF